MIVIGILLILVVIAVTAAFVIGGADVTAIHVGNLDIESTTSTFFFIGASIALAAVLAVWCLVVGVKRWRVRQRELKDLRQRTAETPAAEPTPDESERPVASGSETAALETGSATGEASPTRGREPDEHSVRSDERSISSDERGTPSDEPGTRSSERDAGRDDDPRASTRPEARSSERATAPVSGRPEPARSSRGAASGGRADA